VWNKNIFVWLLKAHINWKLNTSKTRLSNGVCILRPLRRCTLTLRPLWKQTIRQHQCFGRSVFSKGSVVWLIGLCLCTDCSWLTVWLKGNERMWHSFDSPFCCSGIFVKMLPIVMILFRVLLCGLDESVIYWLFFLFGRFLNDLFVSLVASVILKWSLLFLFKITILNKILLAYWKYYVLL